MPKAKPIATLSGLIDSDMDDELDSGNAASRASPDSNQENAAAPAKRGRPKANTVAGKVASPRVTNRRTSRGAGVGKKKAAPRKKAAGKREPLKEQTNIQNGSDTEEVEDFELQEAENTKPVVNPSTDGQLAKKQPAKRKPAPRGRKPAAKEPEPQAKVVEKDGEFEYTPTVARQSKTNPKPVDAAPKGGAERSRSAKEIPESQAQPMDLDPSSLPMDEDAMPQSVYRQTSNYRAASKTRQPAIVRGVQGVHQTQSGRAMILP